jgi:hypothetical protein
VDLSFGKRESVPRAQTAGETMTPIVSGIALVINEPESLHCKGDFNA